MRRGFKNKSKIFYKLLVGLKRMVTFAPAKRENGEKKRYVHRHIELTAVLTEMLEQQKESKRIEKI